MPAKKYIVPFLFLILLTTSLFLRVYKMNSVPLSLEQDEEAIGYNAYSILKTGKDEWGKSYPLYFKSFGDYKLPVYIYSVAIAEKMIGVNEYAVRLPSALSGVLAVITLFFLVKLLTKNTYLAFLVAFGLAINPIHLQFSRTAFEVNMALTLALLGSLFFILGVETKKSYLFYFSLLFFSASLYSYNVTRLLSPLILLVLCILYRDKLLNFKKYLIIFPLIFFAFTLLPFFLSFFSSAGVLSTKSSLITSNEILAKDLEMRSYLLQAPSMFVKVFYNKYVFLIFQYIQNLALVMSGAFYFVSGSTQPNQGIGNVGYFYIFDLPFFIFGITTYINKKIKTLNFFFLWLLICIATLALSKEVPHATRGYFLIIPVIVFSMVGFYHFILYLTTIKQSIVRYTFFGLTIIFMMYDIQFFFSSYFFRFPFTSAKAWHYENKTLAEYLKKEQLKYDKIIINSDTSFTYISLLFYTQFPPQEFINTQKRATNNVLLMAESWGNKYEVRPIDWEKDSVIPNTLIVTDAEHWPPNQPVFRTFYYPERQVVFSDNEKIIQLPKTDMSYVLVRTNDIIKEKTGQASQK